MIEQILDEICQYPSADLWAANGVKGLAHINANPLPMGSYAFSSSREYSRQTYRAIVEPTQLHFRRYGTMELIDYYVNNNNLIGAHHTYAQAYRDLRRIMAQEHPLHIDIEDDSNRDLCTWLTLVLRDRLLYTYGAVDYDRHLFVESGWQLIKETNCLISGAIFPSLFFIYRQGT